MAATVAALRPQKTTRGNFPAEFPLVVIFGRMQTGSQPLSDTHAALRTPVSAVAHTRNGKYRIRRFHAAKLNQLFFNRIRVAGIYQQIIANFNKS
ncbi:MAG: hypothetical protein K2I62_07035 [Alistipes sp.]|nr:hypothetical protein [Alistipes sp.]MDE7344570.1 hypothetical protein [Alistipes sp.]